MFTVDKLVPEMNIVASDIIQGNNLVIYVTLPNDASGSVSAIVHEIKQSIPLGNETSSDLFSLLSDIVVNGKAQINVPNLKVGSYNVTVSYEGDAKYNAVSSSSVVTVSDKLDSVIVIDYVNLTIGEIVTFTAKLNGEVSSDVVITVNGNDNASVNVSAGNYTVVASFAGNTTHKAANTTKVFVVDKIASGVNVSDITFDYGISANTTASLSGATGIIASIEGYENAVKVDGNIITVSDLPAGIYSLTVTTVPDSNHYAVSTKVKVTVNKVPSIVIVSDITFDYGSSGNATISLSGASSVIADVVGYTDAVKVEGNVITVSNLKAGKYILSVTTVPDSNHEAVTVKANITVNKVIINNENFNKFFNQNGELISDIDELTFDGEFSNMDLIISKSVKISAQDAIFRNTTFKVVCDNVSISNMIFNYAGSDSVITAANVANFNMENNTIIYKGNSNNYVVNITNVTTAEVINNLINAQGTDYIYGIIISADNFTLSSNMIKIANTNNACGINILGPSRGTVEFNMLNIKAKKAIYSINTNPSTGILKVGYIGNIINAEAYFVVGIYDDSEEIRENNLNLTGNYVVGVVVLSNATVDGNEIKVNASNEGDEEIPEEIGTSTGIQVKNNATITNNKVESTAKSISVVEGTSNIANNNLVGTMNVESDGNKISGNTIATEEEYAIDLGSSTGNTVNANAFYSDETDANNLIKSENEGNLIENNTIKSRVYLENDSLEFNYSYSASTNYTLKNASSITAFVINHTEANVTVAGNIITVSNLTSGKYILNVTTVPDEGYSPDTVLVNITVNKIDSAITFNNTINFDYNSSGSCNFTVIGGTLAKENITVLNYPYAVIELNGNVITVSNLTAGKHILKVTTTPDSNYNAVNNTLNITVNKINAIISFTNNITFDYGAVGNTTFAVIGGDLPRFNIGVDDLMWVNITVVDNVIYVSNLDAGNYTLKATVRADNDHNTVVGFVNITIRKVNSSVTINDITFDYGTSGNTTVDVSGASITKMNIVVVDHPEAVIVLENNVVSISNLTVGTYILNVTTTPDNNHNSITDSITITVNKVNSSVRFSNDIIFVEGQSGSTSVDVVGVLLKENITVESHPEAIITYVGDVITVSNLTAGKYTLNVITTNNTIYNSVKATLNITVSENIINPVFTIFVNATRADSDVIINVSEINGFTGIVTIQIVDKNITVSLIDGFGVNTTTLTAGNYNAILNFTGNAAFNASYTNRTFTVNPVPVNLGLNIVSENVTFGQRLYIQITTNKTFTGNVFVKVGGANITAEISNGEGYAISPILDADEYIVEVIFEGNKYFEACEKNITVSVEKIDPKLNITADTVYEGSDVLVIVTTHIDFSGNVSVKINDKVYNASVVNGLGNVSLSNLAVGKYNVTATFAETKNFTPSEVNATATVKTKPVDPNLSVSVSNVNYGSPAVIVVTTSMAFTGNVNIKVDGDSYVVNVVKGSGSITVGGLAAGSHSVVVTIAASDDFASSEKATAFTVKSVISLVLKTVTVKKSAKKLTLQATLKINKKAVKGKKITFKFNGKKYTAKTNAKGIAKVTVKKAVLKKLKVGKKVTYTAKYSTKTVKKTVKIKK